MNDGARSPWYARVRRDWWVVVVVALGLGAEVTVLGWLGRWQG